MRKLLFTTIILALAITGFMVSADEDEPLTYEGTIAAVESNDIILEDGIVINTSPKSYSSEDGTWTFVDADGNGNNDLLEALVSPIIVVGEGEYEEVDVIDPLTGDVIGTILVLVAVDAYEITDASGIVIVIRGPGKPPWAKGPKSK